MTKTQEQEQQMTKERDMQAKNDSPHIDESMYLFL